ncbi:MAG TPA: sterol desaturase family protein [Chitinophagales bacterium]|nr:sterol desaturase family protein [Chitinophagales bacterium]
MLFMDITLNELAYKFTHSLTMVLVRYFLFAGTLFLIFYIWKRRHFFKYKIQQKYPGNKNIFREIGYSLLSVSIFAATGTIIFILRKHGYTRIYSHLSDHSLWYFAFTVVAFIVGHDTYFYWSHRLMHWKKIYPYVHKVHHMSTNPTPWAAFAFHPLEAVMEVGILPIMVFTLPVHHYAIFTWMIYQTGMNVIGHLGFELFPSGFVTGKLSKWHNTSTHHNMHHRYVNCNYGLYYNFWDRIMGTNHQHYAETFEEVKTRIREAQSQAPHSEPTGQLAPQA